MNFFGKRCSNACMMGGMELIGSFFSLALHMPPLPCFRLQMPSLPHSWPHGPFTKSLVYLFIWTRDIIGGGCIVIICANDTDQIVKVALNNLPSCFDSSNCSWHLNFVDAISIFSRSSSPAHHITKIVFSGSLVVILNYCGTTYNSRNLPRLSLKSWWRSIMTFWYIRLIFLDSFCNTVRFSSQFQTAGLRCLSLMYSDGFRYFERMLTAVSLPIVLGMRGAVFTIFGSGVKEK